MKTAWILSIGLVLSGCTTVQSYLSGESGDEAFVEKAAESGMLEVQLGKLAQEKSQDQQVQQFGKRMVEDHSKANQELQQIAAREGFAIPQQLEEKAKDKRAELAQLSGSEFDRRYMKEMVKEHEKDVALFERHAEKGQNPTLRTFAEEQIGTLRDHLQHAEHTADAVGAGGR